MNEKGKIPRTAFFGLGLLVVVAFMLTKPVPQPLEYHNFADQRSFFSIPNFWDVTSNGGFLLVGLWGLLQPRNTIRSAQFFVTIMLVCAGSVYYHWSPNNATLVWDRLPMGMGFMTVLMTVLADSGVTPSWHSSRHHFLFQLLGIASVLVWAAFDDLRFYILVQFGSMLALALVLIFRSFPGKPFLVYALFFYVSAKLVEVCDASIYHLFFRLLSGHSLKHFIAALATFFCGRYLLLPAHPPPAPLSFP